MDIGYVVIVVSGGVDNASMQVWVLQAYGILMFLLRSWTQRKAWKMLCARQQRTCPSWRASTRWGHAAKTKKLDRVRYFRLLFWTSHIICITFLLNKAKRLMQGEAVWLIPRFANGVIFSWQAEGKLKQAYTFKSKNKILSLITSLKRWIRQNVVQCTWITESLLPSIQSERL